jgi:AcrR family transcriptional regulator
MVIKQSELCEIVHASGLFEAGLEGVSEARQARSRATVAKLISTGHAMLNDRPLDDLSIEELCSAADCTVGAFYSRFESKEAYFAAVQFVVCADRDRALAAVVAEAGREKWPLQRICAGLVEDLTEWYRANHGVLRASLMHSRNGESSWNSIKELGARHKAAWVELLSHRLPKALPARERKLRVQFANQVMNGTLIHMLLIDPGPVMLHDAAAPKRLSANMYAYLTDAAAPA